MEQREITFPVSLLDRDGRLPHSGYSREMKLRYRRKDVKTPLRLREWDSYLVFAGDIALRLTVSDCGTVLRDSVAFFDLRGGTAAEQDYTRPAMPGRERLPEQSCEGDVHASASSHSIHFLHSAPGERTLIAQVKDFAGAGSLSARIRLFEEPEESLVTALPFEKEGEWLYAQKTVGFRAEGYVRFDGKTWELSGDECRAVLDWGRGVLPKNNAVTWCCGCGTDGDGAPVAFTLGEGGGADDAATENMLFVNGAACKTGKLSFTPAEEQDGAWHISDGEGRLELDFTSAKEIVGKGRKSRRQCVGSYHGKVTLPDGRSIELRDIPGFAERVQG